MARFRTFYKQLWVAKRLIILVSAPVCLFPLILLHDSKETRCAYGVAIMAVYWVTEVLPVAATALLPVAIFPMLGLLPASAVCKSYIKDTSMFVLGVLTLAVAMETCNLRRRVAIRILLMVGSSPKWLMLVLMLPTWLLSMLASDTSVTAMMVPVVTSLLAQLKETKVKRSPSLLAKKTAQQGVNIKHDVTAAEGAKGMPVPKTKKKSERLQDESKTNQDEITNTEDELDIKLSPATSTGLYRRLCKGMSLCVAYAASIGGTGLVTGTSPNLIMQEQAQELFPEHRLESDADFTSWIIFALPASFICLFLAWLWLTLLFFGPQEWMKKRQRDKVKDVLMKETLLRQYQQLGPLTVAEKVVTGHVVALICLWLSREPPMIPGWGSLFPPQFVDDSTAAILIAMSLFVFPAERPPLFCWGTSSAGRRRRRSARSVLDWRTVQTHCPWRVLLLLGGGFAVATVCEVSGLSPWIGQQLTATFGAFTPWQLTFVFSCIVAMATEIISNGATASQLLPILGLQAMNRGINPLYFLFPCTMATSFAFMLPLSTPPNAIVFAVGHLEVKDMVFAGSVLKLLCVLVVNLAVNTWGTAYFGLHTLPSQFNSAAAPNVTTSASRPTTLGALLDISAWETTAASSVFDSPVAHSSSGLMNNTYSFLNDTL